MIPVLGFERLHKYYGDIQKWVSSFIYSTMNSKSRSLRLYSGPGFIYDSHYTWNNSDEDGIFSEMLNGAKQFAKQLYMPVLCLYEESGSPFIEGFTKSGFQKVFEACGNDYYMMSVD